MKKKQKSNAEKKKGIKKNRTRKEAKTTRQ